MWFSTAIAPPILIYGDMKRAANPRIWDAWIRRYRQYDTKILTCDIALALQRIPYLG